MGSHAPPAERENRVEARSAAAAHRRESWQLGAGERALDRRQPRWMPPPGSLRWDAIGTAAQLLAVAYLIWLILGIGGLRTTTVVDDLGEAFFAFFATAACAYKSLLDREQRASWSLIGASALVWGAGELIWTYYEAVLGVRNPFPSLADVGFLAAVPLAAAGILLLPGRSLRTAFKLQAMLDALMIACALLFLSWITALGAVYQSSQFTVIEKTVALTYPVSDVVLATVVIYILTRAQNGSRLALWLLCAGFLANAVADSSFAYTTAAGTFQNGNLIDAGWVGGYLLIGLAAMAATGRPFRVAEDQASSSVLRAALPCLVAALAMAVAAAHWLVKGPLDGFLFWDTIALGAVLTCRQLVSLVDYRLLIRERENRYEAMRASGQLLSEVVQGAPAVLFALDADGKLVFCDGGDLEMLGLEARKLVGRHSRDAFAGSPALVEILAGALRGEPAEGTASVGAHRLDVRCTTLLSSDTGSLDGVIAVGLVTPG